MKNKREFDFLRMSRRRLTMPVSGYVKISKNKISRSRTLIRGHVIADYDNKGRLVGVEVF